MPSGDAAMLVAKEGIQKGRRWLLGAQRVVIGRDPGAGIVINDRNVSREHAEIIRGDGGYFIRDLGSKNGTYVGDQRIEAPRLLRPKDEIRIAQAALLTFVPPDETTTLSLDSMPTPGLLLNEPTRQVLVDGVELHPPLSQAQFRLLHLLVSASGGVRTREGIIAAVWPEESGEGITEQAIDALVRRLRERLAELDPDHAYVVTVRGHGFRFENR